MLKWLLLLIALTLNAAANVLMKIGAIHEKAGAARLAPDAPFLAKTLNFMNAATVIGIALFAANVLVYRKALNALNVSVAYPIMVSGGIVIVTLAAVLLPVLREKLSVYQVAGIVLIAAGVWLVARGQEAPAAG